MSRNLNVELIRIVSMFLIILGHILGGFIPLSTEGSDCFRQILPKLTFFIPFHVNLFILISGYFGIKKLKNIYKIVILIFSYLIVIAFLSELLGWRNFDYSSLLQPISHNPWWFMKIYFLMALISPVLIEPLIEKKTTKNIIPLLSVFLFIDVYLGYYCRMQTVHYDGYNLVHFITIYLIGCYLRLYNIEKNKLRETDTKKLFIVFGLILLLKLIFNFILNIMRVKDYFMDYNNPFNIILSVYAFLFFLSIDIKNPKVLFVSNSVIGVYLISEHPIISEKLIEMFNIIIGLAFGNFSLEVLYMSLFIILLFIFSIIIDKIRVYVITSISNQIRKFIA